jgi:hypothetical protein
VCARERNVDLYTHIFQVASFCTETTLSTPKRGDAASRKEAWGVARPRVSPPYSPLSLALSHIEDRRVHFEYRKGPRHLNFVLKMCFRTTSDAYSFKVLLFSRSGRGRGDAPTSSRSLNLLGCARMSMCRIYGLKCEGSFLSTNHIAYHIAMDNPLRPPSPVAPITPSFKIVRSNFPLKQYSKFHESRSLWIHLCL